MNRLIRKARSGMGRVTAFGIQPSLDGLQSRLEAGTKAEHDDLRREITRLGTELAEVLSGVRAENVEVIRMLRQQGDASDEVAEVLGRTLARLGAEVDALSRAVERLEARLDDEPRASASSGVGDPTE